MIFNIKELQEKHRRHSPVTRLLGDEDAEGGKDDAAKDNGGVAQDDGDAEEDGDDTAQDDDRAEAILQRALRPPQPARSRRGPRATGGVAGQAKGLTLTDTTVKTQTATPIVPGWQFVP